MRSQEFEGRLPPSLHRRRYRFLPGFPTSLSALSSSRSSQFHPFQQVSVVSLNPALAKSKAINCSQSRPCPKQISSGLPSCVGGLPALPPDQLSIPPFPSPYTLTPALSDNTLNPTPQSHPYLSKVNNTSKGITPARAFLIWLLSIPPLFEVTKLTPNR